MKALILEDNSTLAMSLKKLLEGQGWEVRTSALWSKVYVDVENDKYQLILLDILLADKKGVEILQFLSEKKLFPRVVAMSAFFTEEACFKDLSPDLLEHCSFLKKPLDEEKLLQLIKLEKETSSQEWGFFFEKAVPSEPLSFYFPEGEVHPSHQLISLLLSAHFKSFTGQLNLKIDGKQGNAIYFYKGNIIRTDSMSQKSFFGEILVEHGLSLTDDVKQVLEDKSSNKKIGEKLLDRGLLSPQMLDFVLKEQMKIRLSEFMSYSNFELQFKEKDPEAFTKKVDVEFSQSDFIEWLADSIQTELNPEFWKSFYFDMKNYKLCKLNPLNLVTVSQKSFLNQYHAFFKSLEAEQSFDKLIKNEQDDKLKFLFFGLLMKSIYLKVASGGKTLPKKFTFFRNRILSGTQSDVFKLLGYDSKNTLQLSELKKNFKEIVPQVHPDFLPKDTEEQMKEEAEEMFKRLNQSYKKLKKKLEGGTVSQVNVQSNMIEVMNSYKEGIELIQKESYKEAHELFLKIKDHKKAPANTSLYVLWALLKKQAWDLADKDKKVGLSVQKQIDACPIHLRTSYLFWFVKGLFFYGFGNYEKANELFKKTLFIQSSFSPAKLEMMFAKQKIREATKKKGFLSFLKKSS